MNISIFPLVMRNILFASPKKKPNMCVCEINNKFYGYLLSVKLQPLIITSFRR
jgi:hypothetical protein